MKTKTKFIVTTTDITQLDPVDDVDEFGAELENVQVFSSRKKAEAWFKSFVNRTNMDVFLLQVDVIDRGEGAL